jgi:hypothetical protein
MTLVLARSLLEELEAKLTDLDAVIKKADAEKRRKVSKLFFPDVFSAVSLNYRLSFLLQLSLQLFGLTISSCRFHFSARLFRCPFPLSFFAVFFSRLLAIFFELFLSTFSFCCLFFSCLYCLSFFR